MESTFLFLLMLFASSAVTSLIVEGLKKLMSDLSTNLLVFVTAIVVGGVISGYVLYSKMGYAVNPALIAVSVLFGFATAICAMVGYDKVAETVKQISTFKGDE